MKSTFPPAIAKVTCIRMPKVVRTIRQTILSITLLIATATQAPAGLLIDVGPGSSPDKLFGGNYVRGTEFTTTSSQTIRSLAWLDTEGDGLLYTHTVGLWDATTQALLASVDVTPSSPTQLSAHGIAVWYMADISPTLLTPGVYRVAGLVGPTESYGMQNDRIGNGVTLTSGSVRTDFPSGGFHYPGENRLARAILASLSTQSAGGSPPVPEPSTYVMAVLGLLGLGYLGWRRR